jgi:cytochrome c553
MKILKVALFGLIALGLVFSFALAAGDAAKGKALFNDPKFAGGSKACGECHPNGKGIEKAGDKKEFAIMGKAQKSLE